MREITDRIQFAPHLDPLPRYSLRGGREETNDEVISEPFLELLPMVDSLQFVASDLDGLSPCCCDRLHGIAVSYFERLAE